MRILIVGDGKVGHTLATELLREGHDITIIDQDAEVVNKTTDNLDVMCVHGNGANASTLLEAEVDRADIITFNIFLTQKFQNFIFHGT